MNICISSTGTDLNSQIDPRFGRCAYFIIVNPKTLEYQAIPNQAQNTTGGAGIQAAQTVADKQVKTVITGNVGPNAFTALTSAKIDIITGATGTVKEAIEKYNKGDYQKTTQPTAKSHQGMGKGSGLGYGRSANSP